MTRARARTDAKALLGAWAAVVGVALGCGPITPYRPGFLLVEPLSLPDKPPGTAAARRVGCLDVRMALGCNAAVAPDLPLVAFTLGNRCDAAIPVDFTRVRVVGRREEAGVAGDEKLSPFDPRKEIYPAVLGARAMAREVFEYDATPREKTRNIRAVCIDVGELSSGGAPGSPVCLTRPVDACARR